MDESTSTFKELHVPGTVFITDLFRISTTPVKILMGSSVKPPVLSYVSLCNLTVDEVLFSLYVDTGAANFYIYKDYPITKGSTFVIERDYPEFVKLKPSWEMFLTSDTADGLDATVSKIVSEGNRIT